MNPNINQIKQVLKNKNYQFFDNGLYNINIIGIRSSSQQVDVFNDLMTVIYKNESGEKIFTASCTTKPGSFYLKNPDNPQGCGILVPNQYSQAFTIGQHKGEYECLIQCKTLKVYRDNSKSGVFHYTNIQDAPVQDAIEIHHAGANSSVVYNWSALCQVFQKISDFQIFMNLVNKAKELHGNKFTYTLITEKDLI